MEKGRTIRLLRLTIVITFIVLGASAANLVVQPPEEEPDTEFYILGSDNSGDPTAGRYVESFRSTNGSIYFGIEHRLDTTQQYTLIVQLQQAYEVDESIIIVERMNVKSIQVRVSPETTEVRRMAVDRPIDRQYSRAVFLVFLGPAPQNPSIENAHRSTYIWLNTETEANR